MPCPKLFNSKNISWTYLQPPWGISLPACSATSWLLFSTSPSHKNSWLIKADRSRKAEVAGRGRLKKGENQFSIRHEIAFFSCHYFMTRFFSLSIASRFVRSSRSFSLHRKEENSCDHSFSSCHQHIPSYSQLSTKWWCLGIRAVVVWCWNLFSNSFKLHNKKHAKCLSEQIIAFRCTNIVKWVKFTAPRWLEKFYHKAMLVEL